MKQDRRMKRSRTKKKRNKMENIRNRWKCEMKEKGESELNKIEERYDSAWKNKYEAVKQ